MSELSFKIDPEWRELSLELRNFFLGEEDDDPAVLDAYTQEVINNPKSHDLPTVARVLIPHIRFSRQHLESILQDITQNNCFSINLSSVFRIKEDDDLAQKLAKQLILHPDILTKVIGLLAIFEGEKLGIVDYSTEKKEYNDYAHEEYFANTH